MHLRPGRGARLMSIEHERRGADAAQVGHQRAAVGADLEMPLDVPLVGGFETPVDQVDEDITLEIGAVHRNQQSGIRNQESAIRNQQSGLWKDKSFSDC